MEPSLILCIAAVCCLVLRRFLHRTPTLAFVSGRALTGAAFEDAAPDPLKALEWDAPVAAHLPAPDSLPDVAPVAPGEARKRVRDRYVALRFAGCFASVEELRNADRVMEAARLYCEDRDFDRADELLQMAIVLSPRDKALRLAQLEVAFLRRDLAAYAGLARALREALPECAEWDEVQRLGRALVCDEPHTGPWPDTPNWIGASWDAAAEARAGEFHRAISDLALPGGHGRLRNAA